AGPSEPWHAHPGPSGESPRAFFHDADDLVSWNQGELRIGELAVGDVQVGAADAACAHPQEDLSGLRARIRQLAQIQWTPRLDQDHGSHDTPPPEVSSLRRLRAPEGLPARGSAPQHQHLLSGLVPIGVLAVQRVAHRESIGHHGHVAEDVDRVLELLERVRPGVVDVLLVAADDRLAALHAALQRRRDDDGGLIEQLRQLGCGAGHPSPVAAPDQVPDLALLIGHLSPPEVRLRVAPPAAPGVTPPSRPPTTRRAVPAPAAVAASWRRWPAPAPARSRRRTPPARRSSPGSPRGSRTRAPPSRRAGGRAGAARWSPARARSSRGRADPPARAAASPRWRRPATRPRRRLPPRAPRRKEAASARRRRRHRRPP